MVGIYRYLFAALTEFMTKSMKRRTRYHLVFGKTERNKLMILFADTHGILLEEKHRVEGLEVYGYGWMFRRINIMFSCVMKKRFDRN